MSTLLRSGIRSKLGDCLKEDRTVAASPIEKWPKAYEAEYLSGSQQALDV
jgi:hypothetical protein